MTIWTIAIFEFKRYFKWKQELISIGLMLFAVGLTTLWPIIKNAVDKDYQVAIVSEFSQVALPKLEGFQFSQISPATRDTAKNAIGETWAALVEVEQGKLKLIVKEKASWQGKLKSSLSTWQQQRLIEQLPLSEQQRKQIKDLPEVEVQALKVEKEKKDDKSQGLVSGGVLFLLTLGIFSGFGFLFTGITSEKQNRVTEQLLTLITPSQWMTGKIIGISLFCIKTMVTSGLIFFLFIQFFSRMDGDAGISISIAPFELFSILLYIVLGMLMVNSFMAGFAATIDDPNHSSRSFMMFLPGIPVGLAFSMIHNAEGAMMQFLSIFPLTSYAAMPLRMANTSVPMWQWLLSVSLLVLCMWWLKSAATRIFELGIRMYGKEPDWSLLLSTFLFPSKQKS